MRHWLQLATRSWRSKAGRSALAVLSITLGVGVVVWVTCCYESVRRGMTNVVLDWIGRGHVVIESTTGVWGVYDEKVRDWVNDVPGVAHVTMRTREYVEVAPQPAATTTSPGQTFSSQPTLPAEDSYFRIEVAGILPASELLFRNYKMLDGRMLTASDRNSVVLENLLAKRLGAGVGDRVYLRDNDPPANPRAFTVIGVVDRRRASMNQALMAWTQLGDVQEIARLPGKVKSIEMIAADSSLTSIRRIADDVRKRIETHKKAAGDAAPSLEVRTTEAQHQKLGAAQGLLQFIMMLLACVVLLTAFFIILATMSMGVTERIAELGLLRCVGVTRTQLGSLILAQSLPIGMLGTVIGVPLGLGLQWITMQIVPDYLGAFAVSRTGILLAVLGGLGTTLLGAVVPAVRAFEVSPAEATRSPSSPNLTRWAWVAAGLGVVLLVVHEIVNRNLGETGTARFDANAIASVILLYLGAALLSPLIVIALAKPAVHTAGRILGLRHELLGDEIHKAPFRSASICSGLMVGLSLIVGLVVWGESVKAGWQFPKEFPDALL
ncbi:MAG TPA: ABC transporter permease, partial [Phycisphaerae bacterium]|nr:ABC transporter permease [Phycisphaerae bacterium]